MTLDEIHDEIEKDSIIDENKIQLEVLKIPMLHSKYMRMYTTELKDLQEMQFTLAKIKLRRSNFYLNRSSDSEYQNERLNIKIAKTEVDMFLDADEKYGEAVILAADQKAKVEVIEKFIQTLNNRGYALRTAVDFLKFRSGA